MAIRTSFIVYHSYYEAVKHLSDSELGTLYRAMHEYHLTGVLPSMSTGIQIAFNFIKSQFDRDQEKYNSIVERNRINGLKGGRPNNPEKPKKPTGLSGNPEKPRHNPKEPKKPDTDTDTDTDTEVCSSAFQKIYDHGCGIFPNLATSQTSPIHSWLAGGCSAELDAIPEIDRQKKKGKMINSWSFFTAAVMDAMAARASPPKSGKVDIAKPNGQPETKFAKIL